ncbi:4Fe-4S dicluster domain-containing protein [Adlercreutzia shanghongiae]|uniref:4Fe-4S ferredoxin-type domain-containing protein n=1 Tax=Adlercreutzia shanghongiae TaxID=3111773 RepID=A0ABU6J067_9ACTN|nr:hypothetical protein [Adlercreutzia sp. R22]MEC4295403.1 hypothetical protein [Adlercreutzia sp. R22]
MAEKETGAIKVIKPQGKVTRRGFVGMMGMMGALGLGGCAPKAATKTLSETGADDADGAGSEAAGEREAVLHDINHDRSVETAWSGSAATLAGIDWSGTPENIQKVGGSTMPLEELNNRRQLYVDSQTAFTCSDGTVVPEVYVKLYALINTYSCGSGNIPNDLTFSYMMEVLDEEHAQALLDSPMGVWFSAGEMAEKTGRSVEDCDRLLKDMRKIGYICAADRVEGTVYHQPALGALGGYLMTDEQFAKCKGSDGNFSCLPMGDDYFDHWNNAGTSYYYPVPCDKSVVDSGEILECDDVEALFARHEHFAVAPCACSYFETIMAVDDYPTLADFRTGEYTEYTHEIEGDDLRLERCLFTGEEAQFWVELGIAREIDRNEAMSILRRNVEEGYVIEPYFQSDSACVCSCKGSVCAGLGGWMASYAEGPDIYENANAYQQVSHYDLVVDFDRCLKCGMCSLRCQMQAIEMTGEDGTPEITGLCVRCGQCAYTCPAEARKLHLRPEEELLMPIPDTLCDDWNSKAAFRFEQGFIW